MCNDLKDNRISINNILNSEHMFMLRVLIEWMIQTYMLNIFDIVVIYCLNIMHVETDRVLYDNIHLFTLM